MNPQFRITNVIAGSLTRIERARGFLDAAQLSEEWITGMQQRALVLEAHHTTHIEGTHLTLDQSERLLAGEKPPGVGADDAKEVVNYRKAFDLVADYLGSGDPITEGPVREIHKQKENRFEESKIVFASSSVMFPANGTRNRPPYRAC
jgi:Fic family protein